MAKTGNNIVPIQNIRLEEAMSQYKKEGSKENLKKLMESFIAAKLLVPADLPKNVSEIVKAKIAMKQRLTPAEAPKAIPILLKKPSGECIIPVYTQHAKIPADRKYPLILTLPVTEVVRVALGGKSSNIVGVVINAGTDNITLHQKFIEAVASVLTNAGKNVQGMSAQNAAAASRLRAETEVIPRHVYAEKSEFLDKLESGKEEFVLSLYREAYGKTPCTLAKDDFSVMVLDIGDMTIAQIMTPEKKTLPRMALSLYAVQMADSGDMGYYYIEKGETEDKNVITRVTADGLIQQLRSSPAPGTELSEVIDLIQSGE